MSIYSEIAIELIESVEKMTGIHSETLQDVFLNHSEINWSGSAKENAKKASRIVYGLLMKDIANRTDYDEEYLWTVYDELCDNYNADDWSALDPIEQYAHIPISELCTLALEKDLD